MLNRRLSVWTASLGCPKNMVDTEHLLGSLGYDISITKKLGRSRLVFINTCAFIEPAVRESIREILKAVNHAGKLKKPPLIVVAGCMVGRYGRIELEQELPEVDLWLSPGELDNWPGLIRNLLQQEGAVEPGRYHPRSSYAWLKISDGCDHRCTFCTIPSIRGSHRAASAQDILLEAKQLLARGARELVLVGQDVSAWSNDNKNLCDLLSLLVDLPQLHWLRLLYLYPGGISRKLLETFAAAGPTLLPYFDIPFQHVESGLLRKMGRPFAINPVDVVARIRGALPGAALRTSLIAGFPGESDKDFEMLCEFVRQSRFHNLGVFCYFAEEGTPAARLPGQIPEAEKSARRQELMRIQAGISQEILSQYVGRELEVLVDRDMSEEWPGLHAGRVWFQAPEIDGITYVSGPGIETGATRLCRIEQSMVYDLNALA